MPNNTQDRIKEVQESRDILIITIGKCDRLLMALSDYKNKTVNATFFEKYFLEGESEHRTWTEFRLKQADYREGQYQIWVGHNKNIYTPSRDRLDLIKAVTEAKENWKEQLFNTDGLLNELLNFNEDQFLADIKAVYIKHGSPAHANKILDSYAFYTMNKE